MDVAALASALIAARSGGIQLAMADEMLRMNADSAASVVKLIDAAQQSSNRLANVAAGVGQNLDISA